VTNDPDVFDLSQDREARTAQNEVSKKPLVMRFHSNHEPIALSPELPLSALAPLRRIDSTIAIMLRSVVDAARDTDAEARWNATELVIDLIAANPTLPIDVIDVIRDIATNLLGEAGYEALMAASPSVQDCASLAKRIFAYYGVGLGESSPSSDSSEGGSETSSSTSSGTAEGSTPAVSSSTPESPASSA